ncbi:hypothetical protein FRC03_004889 [Tulasnella sp. 419]|nr:hypothetical protein FRC03_004889 [Tulasnella sp. 419]
MISTQTKHSIFTQPQHLQNSQSSTLHHPITRKSVAGRFSRTSGIYIVHKGWLTLHPYPALVPPLSLALKTIVCTASPPSNQMPKSQPQSCWYTQCGWQHNHPHVAHAPLVSLGDVTAPCIGLRLVD